MGTTTRTYTIRRDGICALTAAAIRLELAAAHEAHLLDSFAGAFSYDPEAQEVFIVFGASHMHPSHQASFGCECAVADALVARAIARHRGPSSPPRGM